MEEIALTGILEKVIYYNKENEYTVLSIKIKKNNNETVQGYIGDLPIGEKYTFIGEWTFHIKFGRQFLAKKCLISNSLIKKMLLQKDKQRHLCQQEK